MDSIRLHEYSHLEEEDLACLDYCGFGLFSQAQQEDIAPEEDGYSSRFSLTEISANLWSHALFGYAAKGTMEYAIRARIMEFLSLPVSEYSMVFTSSRGATFKLLADAYPWSSSSHLVTMYDYESESVGWMEKRAAEGGANVYRARFRWPSLRVCSAELKKVLTAGSGKKIKVMRGKKQQQANDSDSRYFSDAHPPSRPSVASWLDRVSLQQQNHRKGDEKKGLFVFPVQSRISGAKYSYQWMSLAQQNQWRVLLDASALGPKDMDSLGLSLFRPDFITASFYRLFGGDPSGFGCLLIKNSVAQSIQGSSGAPVSGMVHITPLRCQWDFTSSSLSEDSGRYDDTRTASSFSGPMPPIEELDVPFLPDADGRHVSEDDRNSAFEDAEVSSCGTSEDGHESPLSGDGGHNSLVETSDAELGDPLPDSHLHSTVPTGNSLMARRDNLSSKNLIKGLCSGLLHLHSGRVGNSADSIEEVGEVMKEPSRERHKKSSIAKRVAFQKKGFLDAEKPALSVSSNKSQCDKHGNGGPGEPVPERLILVLRRIREEQTFIEDGTAPVCPQVKNQDQLILEQADNGGPLHQEGEPIEDAVDQGGFGTVEESEGEIEFQKPASQSGHEGTDRATLEVNESDVNVGTDALKDAIAKEPASAICRETEGGFRLLGRRDLDPVSLGRALFPGSGEESFALRSASSGQGMEFSMGRSIVSKSDEDQAEEEYLQEPQLLCKSLDHADMMGLNRTSARLRYLINWLVRSLLVLQHPNKDISLVRIYGPQVKYDRGASVAFNIFDSEGKAVQPEMVRMLADRVNISLGLGFLRNLCIRGNTLEAPFPNHSEEILAHMSNKAPSPGSSRMEVLTAALGLLSDFRDVFRLWSFVAKFLDPNFISSELRYHQTASSSSSLCI
ncbi:hypothetical protein KP509_10G021100 [Ceratopteris richardii]|nr:hypothetical protein KP509_10G021100 [Ceratopteris richardii]